MPLFVAAFLFAAPRSAHAESVAVLNLRALDGDDEVANVLSSLIHRSAEQVPGWTILAGDRGLDQLMLAHECESANDECVARIAAHLRVERVLYGTLARQEGAFEVVLHSFYAARGEVDHVATQRFSSRQTDVDDLREPMRRMIVDLAARTSATRAEDIPQAAPEPPPPAAPATDPRVIERWAGVASLSVGTVFLAAALYAWIRLPQIDNDLAFDQYRMRFPPSVTNVCLEAAAGAPGMGPSETTAMGFALASRVDGLCRESDRLNILQYVFVGLAVAGLGVGTFLLVRSTRDDPTAPLLSIVPSASPTGASLSAELRF